MTSKFRIVYFMNFNPLKMKENIPIINNKRKFFLYKEHRDSQAKSNDKA